MRITSSKEFGALVRERRRKMRWSQEDLASHVGVSRLWIVQLEKGKPSIQLGLVLRTLRELGFALDITDPSSNEALNKPPAVDLDQVIRSTLPRAT